VAVVFQDPGPRSTERAEWVAGNLATVPDDVMGVDAPFPPRLYRPPDLGEGVEREVQNVLTAKVELTVVGIHGFLYPHHPGFPVKLGFPDRGDHLGSQHRFSFLRNQSRPGDPDRHGTAEY